MTLVDTGAWFASVVPWDANHVAARDWLRRNREPLVTTDYVVDETLTLLRVRHEAPRALALGALFFRGDLATIHFLSESEVRGAWTLFERFADKEWSFTDCTSKLVIESLGLSTAFSFDQHFRQFGSVTVVP
jgi:predicted nucleic acid-binding protein